MHTRCEVVDFYRGWSFDYGQVNLSGFQRLRISGALHQTPEFNALVQSRGIRLGIGLAETFSSIALLPGRLGSLFELEHSDARRHRTGNKTTIDTRGALIDVYRQPSSTSDNL